MFKEGSTSPRIPLLQNACVIFLFGITFPGQKIGPWNATLGARIPAAQASKLKSYHRQSNKNTMGKDDGCGVFSIFT